MRDEVDAAVREKGWRTSRLTERGQTYEAYLRPALTALLDMTRADKKLRLWSGSTGPAPLTTMRE